MIQIRDPKDCCGCGACAQVCPQGCISMVADAEGFDYPRADAQRCTQCGRCDRVCPVLNRNEPAAPLHVRGAVNRSAAAVSASSSGGLFHALATDVLRRGGVLCAARFDAAHRLRHQVADSEADLPAFLGSKYVQSTTGDAFRQVQHHLRAGRPVLFCGTPCMVAGLNRYLGRDDEQLLTADIICHGVPSPGLWQRFFDALLARRGLTHDDVAAVSFRDKAHGWRKYRFVVTLKDGRRLSFSKRRNSFQRAFDQSLTLRPCCYDCPVRRGRSRSDLTLADFWDIAYVRPDLDKDRGVSLVFCNTPKGTAHFPETAVDWFDTDFAAAVAHNPAFTQEHTPCHPKRADFFSQLPHTDDVDVLLKQALRLPLGRQLALDFSQWKYQLKQQLLRLLKR